MANTENIRLKRTLHRKCNIIQKFGQTPKPKWFKHSKAYRTARGRFWSTRSDPCGCFDIVRD